MEDDRLDTIEAIKEFTGIGSFKANIIFDAGFDSVDKLKEASVDELVAIKGISRSAAEKIIATIEEKGGGKKGSKKKESKEEEEDMPDPDDIGEEELAEMEPLDEDEINEDLTELVSTEPAKTMVAWEDDDDDDVQEAVPVEEEEVKTVEDKTTEEKVEEKIEKARATCESPSAQMDIGAYNLSIYECAMLQAWDDGLISEDERALLESLRTKLSISGDDHLAIESKIRAQMASSTPAPAQQPVQQQSGEIDAELEADILRAQQQSAPPQQPVQQPMPQQQMPQQQPQQPQPQQQPMQQEADKPKLITLDRSRGAQQKGPMDFAQIKDGPKSKGNMSHIECPKCGSAVPVHSNERPITVQCPNCGAKGKLEIEDKVTEADLAELNYMSIEEIISQAEDFYKKGALNKSYAFYSKALQLDPTDKKAGFFKKKIKSLLAKRAEDKRVKVKQITTMPTGVRRLDDLTGKGGLPYKTQTLLLGPSFIGKETLISSYISQGLKDNIPCVIVLTSKSPEDIRTNVSYMTPNFAELDQKGLIHFIDAYSVTMGIFKQNTNANVHTIQDIKDTNTLLNTIAQVQQDVNQKMGPHRLIFYSLSNVLTHIGIQNTLMFLQTLVARNNEYRGTCLYDLAKGIHQEGDITAIEYQMDAIIEFKSEENRNFLKIRGMGEDVKTRDWVEYKFNKKELSIIGSFTMEYIA